VLLLAQRAVVRRPPGGPEALKLKVLNAISATLGNELTPDTCVVTGADVLTKQAGCHGHRQVEASARHHRLGLFFRALFYMVLLVGSKNKRKWSTKKCIACWISHTVL
jgi:hypothetical protein